jgi:hypothetical protein
MTKYLLLILLILTAVFGQFTTTRSAHADVDLSAYRTLRFNNENWHTLPHPRVLSFSVHEDGSVTGLTENGISFVQFNVPNEYGIRVQRFEIQDHYHFIVDGEIANSVRELSALLAVAYAKTNS